MQLEGVERQAIPSMPMLAKPALAPRHLRSIVALALLGVVLAILPWVRERISRSLEAEGYVNLGAAALEKGRAQDAEAAWLQAGRLMPGNPNVYRALGSLYLSQNRLAEARRTLNRLADLAPREPHALCELAEEELRSGSAQLLEAAATDGERAAKLEPDCIRAQTVAGNAWLTRGDERRTILFLRRAVYLKPADVPLALHFARVLLNFQRPREAAVIGQDLVRRYPGAAEGYALLGNCYLVYPAGSTELGQAAGLFQQALSLDPLNAGAHSRLGHLQMESAEWEQARRNLECAHFLAPRDTAVMFDLARVYRRAGRASEAAALEAEFRRWSTLETTAGELEKRLLLDPGNQDLLRQLEGVTHQLGDPERLQRARQRAARPLDAKPQ